MATNDYYRIEKAIRFLESNFGNQPSLGEMARSINISPYHFERLFKRWAGVTPKQFLQLLTLEYSKKLLDESRTTLVAAHSAGLSGGGRLYDHFVSIDAVTPGEYKSGGVGLTISYGLHETLFGRLFIGISNRGICSLNFVESSSVDSNLNRLHENWPNARIFEDKVATRLVSKKIEQSVEERKNQPLHLLLKGTNFQLKVWQALLNIPPGYVLSHSDVAVLVGKPRALRSISNALSKNPIAYLIPCHRVIQENGVLGNYLWGNARKKAILGREIAANAKGFA